MARWAFCDLDDDGGVARSPQLRGWGVSTRPTGGVFPAGNPADSCEELNIGEVYVAGKVDVPSFRTFPSLGFGARL